METSIRPGDDVTVFGRVRRDPDAEWGDSLVVSTGDAETGLCTNLSADAVAGRSLANVALSLALGTVMFVGPLAVLVAMVRELGLV